MPPPSARVVDARIVRLVARVVGRYWVHQEQSGKQRRVRLHPEVEVSSEQTTLETLRCACANAATPQRAALCSSIAKSEDVFVMEISFEKLGFKFGCLSQHKP